VFACYKKFNCRFYFCLQDHFISDCRTTAGMGILVVIKVMCPAENVVSTVGSFLSLYQIRKI